MQGAHPLSLTVTAVAGFVYMEPIKETPQATQSLSILVLSLNFHNLYHIGGSL